MQRSHFLTTQLGKWSLTELAKQIVPALTEACNGDLLSAIRVERESMLFLAKVPQDSWAESLQRYKSMMLLLAEHDATIPASFAPPDVQRLWHAHLLSPRAYGHDMQKQFGKKIVPASPLISDATDEELWQNRILCSCDRLDSSAIAASNFDFEFDIVASAKRQRNFAYQTSLPHFNDEVFLQASLLRYFKFLTLQAEFPESGPLNPTYDIDLVWHSHMKFHDAYVSDTRRLLGKTLPHDDSVTERHPGSRLDNANKRTVSLWEKNHILLDLTQRYGADMGLFARWFFSRKKWANKIRRFDREYQFQGGMWRGEFEKAGLASIHDVSGEYPKSDVSDLLDKTLARSQGCTFRVVECDSNQADRREGFHALNAKHGWQKFHSELRLQQFESKEWLTLPQHDQYSIFWRSMDQRDVSNNRFIELHPPTSGDNARELSQPVASVSFLEQSHLPTSEWVQRGFGITSDNLSHRKNANTKGCAMSIQDQYGDDTVILFGKWSAHKHATPKAKRRERDDYNDPGDYGNLDIEAWYRNDSQWIKRRNIFVDPGEKFQFPGVSVDFEKHTHMQLNSGDKDMPDVPINISIALGLGIMAMRVALDPAPSYSWYCLLTPPPNTRPSP